MRFFLRFAALLCFIGAVATGIGYEEQILAVLDTAPGNDPDHLMRFFSIGIMLVPAFLLLAASDRFGASKISAPSID